MGVSGASYVYMPQIYALLLLKREIHNSMESPKATLTVSLIFTGYIGLHCTSLEWTRPN